MAAFIIGMIVGAGFGFTLAVLCVSAASSRFNEMDGGGEDEE